MENITEEREHGKYNWGKRTWKIFKYFIYFFYSTLSFYSNKSFDSNGFLFEIGLEILKSICLVQFLFSLEKSLKFLIP